MPFTPTAFTNLAVYSSGSTTQHEQFDGSSTWHGDEYTCPTAFGFATCNTFMDVADPDPDALDPFFLGADFMTLRADGGVATFQTGTLTCASLLDGGGCGPAQTPDDEYMELYDQSGNLLAGYDPTGTPVGSGPWDVHLGGGDDGPQYLINPHPPTYFGIDPANGANAILWRPADLTGLQWRWTGLHRAGSAVAEIDIAVALYHYVDLPPSSPGVRFWA